MDRFSTQNKLNKEQLEAVTHKEGPLMIIAGAGTGKTTVVTERIKWLIEKELAKPAEILALTFTEKAAKEMEERIDLVMPYGYTQMNISTFHAFGEKILRQEAIQIGLDSGYGLMTEAESVIFFRKNLFNFSLEYFRPMGNPNKFIEGMLKHFARLKDEDISPSDYIHWAQSQISNLKSQNEEEKINKEKYLELANTYRKYEELKIKDGAMDYADLIANVLKLFRTRKNVLAEYQNTFKYILVDEFQDTNFAQNELAVLLCGKRKNITVVGDDDQAIYRFRGAAVSNIIQFRKRFPEAKTVVLTRNYRSSRNILNASYKLIQHNNPDRLEIKEKVNKKLSSERKLEGEAIRFFYTDRVEEEAQQVAKEIKNQKTKSDGNARKGSYYWKDFAILVRANNQSEPFTRALARENIPYQFLGPGRLFKQPEIKDLIAYLKLLDNFTDSVAVYRVLSMKILDISAKDLAAVVNFARLVGLSLLEALETLRAYYINDEKHWSKNRNYQGYLPYISQKSKEQFNKFYKMVERHLKLARNETAGQILYYFLEDSGLLKNITEYKSSLDERRALNISKFFNKLKTYESEHEDASVAAVVSWIEMSMELGESPLSADTDWIENDAVNILTVHAAKGLEFPVVFLVNLVAGRFPTLERSEQIPIPAPLIKEIIPEGDFHLEEERRLFYVGMTRAMDKLFFSASKYYGEGKRERKISPFAYETLGEDRIIKQLNHENIRQLSFTGWNKKEEIETDSQKIPIRYLSYSQINTFLTCPLQYRYRYVLKIPAPTTAAGSFGTSIHLALQRFYEMMKQKEKLTKQDLLMMLDEVWLPVGYGSKTYEEKMKKRGMDMLETYFDKEYAKKVRIVNLEQVFKIKITENLKIGGKIDRIDETNGGKIEIIDYKTGKRSSEKEIKENLQMTVYALAATDRGIYNKKVENVILSFYFFDTQEKVSTTRSSQQLQDAKEHLIQKAKEIEESSFQPKTGRWCKFCDFRLICEAW